MSSSEPKFRQEIQQMMYVSGETLDPSTETIILIETLVQQQVFHMLKSSQELAWRRGARFFSNDDLIFQVRDDTARVERIRNFLAWKAVRKTTKDADGKEATDDLVFGEDDAGAGSSQDATGTTAQILPVSLPWDVESFYEVQVPVMEHHGELIGAASLEKLRKNDERTQDMTASEYAIWSQYRHASFTWRKAKRFREWAGLGIIAEHKPNDDVLDILGFITSEMVQNLTIEALKIQCGEIASREYSMDSSYETQDAGGLFSPPPRARNPLEARHIRQAFQNLQSRRLRKTPFKRRGGVAYVLVRSSTGIPFM
ncbi:spt3 [Trichoderma harzianum]|uniref:Spt3 n=1 Tax=Trichoderma harzianum TaxID=5544 RepID=A0A0G0A0G8_TRIHA|nr:spt3 [Trichoderma harzianum]